MEKKRNLWVIPTDKPSRLFYYNNHLGLARNFVKKNDGVNPQNIYITSDEEIKEGDWVIENHTFKREPYIGKCFYPKNDGTVTDEVLKRDLLSVNYEGHYETLALKHNCKKIILTTDQDLIKDGVQAIGDEFIEWFVKNANESGVPFDRCEFEEVYPLNCCIKKQGKTKANNGCMERNRCLNYKIIIPQEEPKFVTFNVESATGRDLGKVSYIPLPNVDYIPKQETLEEAAEIDLTNLCYYDKRNPDCSADDEEIEDYKKSLLKKDKTCSCDNCFYGRTELTKQLIWQAERMYSESDKIMKFLNTEKELKLSDAKTIERIKWYFETYFEQFKKK